MVKIIQIIESNLKLKEINDFAKKYKEAIPLILMLFEAIVLITGILVVFTGMLQLKEIEKQNGLYDKQLNLTGEELKINQDMLRFQYKPQILIELISTRKSPWFTYSGYEEPNVIQIYSNDFSKTQTMLGNYEETGDASFPLKIRFYNFGSVGTKVETIESSNSCNSWKKHLWQMDIMKTRILLPQTMIEYDPYYMFMQFDKKPTNYTFCDLNVTYTFFNGFQINEVYKIHYSPFNNSFRDVEVQNYESWASKKREERLDSMKNQSF